MAEATPAPTVQVGPTRDPLGRASVLLQVGDQWWLTMSPAEARHLAVTLFEAAFAIDGGRRG